MYRTLKIFLIVIYIFLIGCSSTLKNSITQVSTIDALLAGVYDGEMTCKDLLKYGDFGLGTFDKLDGEMLILDGKIYQIKANGRVYKPSPEMKTPFAAISKFRTSNSFPIKENITMKKLIEFLDTKLSNSNIFYGFKITGYFTKMKTRSVPIQTKPYPSLIDVTKNQSVFNIENTSGTIVGYRCPDYVKGINVPGYHLHFISDDFLKGGHILDFICRKGNIKIDTYNEFSLILPDKNRDFNQTNLKIDRQNELHKVEKE